MIVCLVMFANASSAQCGDEEYVNWMGQMVKDVKEKLGEFAKLIPASLPIAQSALETGYGTSYSARKRNNLFGLSPNGKLATFSTPNESVHYYLETLSEKKYYWRFRKHLQKGETNSLKLLKVLAPVYAKDPEYVVKVTHIIESCDLKRHDLDMI